MSKEGACIESHTEANKEWQIRRWLWKRTAQNVHSDQTMAQDLVLTHAWFGGLGGCPISPLLFEPAANPPNLEIQAARQGLPDQMAD